MKMTIENQKQTRNETPKVVLKRADRETTTKSEGSIARKTEQVAQRVLQITRTQIKARQR